MIEITTGYCKICKKEVTPIKKPLKTIEKVIWVLIILATLGIALIVYLIYQFRIVKKKHCPICYTVVDFKKMKEIKEQEEKKPKFDTTTSKGKVLAKVEKAKEKSKTKQDTGKMFCEFCGAQIPSSSTICPSCQTKVE